MKMIKIDFEEPNDSDWKKWIENCKEETKKLIQSYKDGNPIEFNNLYKAQKEKFYKKSFFGKCAYCESNVEINSPQYIEHYRPKGGITHLNNKVVYINKGDKKIPHPGYYWLAYDWHNLLPTCWKCNTRHEEKNVSKMIGKGNRFPVIGKQATLPGEEANELALIINPLWEDPSNYIHIDSLGIIHANQDSEKGKITIEIFGLDIREELINGRKNEYERIKNKVQLLYIFDNKNKEKELKEIKEIAAGSNQFTLAARKAISDVINSSKEINNNLKMSYE